MALNSFVKKLQEIMRKDSGVDGDAQRLSQLSWMLFLKIYDYLEEEKEFDPNYVPVIPVNYRWRDWAHANSKDDEKNLMTGQQLLDFVNNDLLKVLATGYIQDGNVKSDAFYNPKFKLVKTVMSDAINYMKNGYQLREVINLIDNIDLDDQEEFHAFNEIYEQLLNGLQSAGTMGEFYTPRAITDFVVEMIDPQVGGLFADWAAGTGGFLISALDYLNKKYPEADSATYNKIRTSVCGGELKPLAYKLLITNLLLHDVEDMVIHYGDSLCKAPDIAWEDMRQSTYVAINPPYGGVALDGDVNSFPYDLQSRETADLFVVLAIKRLERGGKGAIVLPDGFLFGNDTAKTNIKKYFLKECNVHTIIRLPRTCFSPYTSIATNLVFFDKGKSTEEIWFYRLDMPDGYKAFSKTKPLKKEHLDLVRNWWKDREEILDEKEHEEMSDTYKSKKVSLKEIEENGYNLDFCGFPIKEKIILSPEETLANYLREREEYNRAMDEKIRKIQMMLKEVG